MLKQGAAEGVDIGPRVLDLSNCPEDAGNGVEAFSCQIADIVVLDVGICELLQMEEAGIGVPQDSVAVSWNDLSFTERLLHVFFDDLLAGLFTFVVGLEFGQPLEAFLVGEAVQWTG